MTLYRKISFSKSGKTRDEHYWLNGHYVAKREGITNKGDDRLTRQEAVDRSGTVDDPKLIRQILDELFALDQGCFWPAPGGVTAWEEFDLNWLIEAVEEERDQEATAAKLAQAEARVAAKLAAAEAISDEETLEWLQSQAWREVCDADEVIGVHYPGGGRDDKGYGEHVVVHVRNGRTFKLANTCSGDQGGWQSSTAFTIIEETGRTLKAKKVVKVKMHQKQAGQFARFVQLSDAAGNHRALDPLVSRQVNVPTAKMIGKWGQLVDTNSPTWGQLKDFCRGKSEMNNDELVRVFRLFNQCVRH